MVGAFGAAVELNDAVDQAFPGAKLVIPEPGTQRPRPVPRSPLVVKKGWKR